MNENKKKKKIKIWKERNEINETNETIEAKWIKNILDQFKTVFFGGKKISIFNPFINSKLNLISVGWKIVYALFNVKLKIFSRFLILGNHPAVLI